MARSKETGGSDLQYGGGGRSRSEGYLNLGQERLRQVEARRHYEKERSATKGMAFGPVHST